MNFSRLSSYADYIVLLVIGIKNTFQLVRVMTNTDKMNSIFMILCFRLNPIHLLLSCVLTLIVKEILADVFIIFSTMIFGNSFLSHDVCKQLLKHPKNGTFTVGSYFSIFALRNKLRKRLLVFLLQFQRIFINKSLPLVCLTNIF